MSRKEIMLLSMALLLLAGYFYFFTDAFKRQSILIRLAAPRQVTGSANRGAPPAGFDLMMKYALTSVKVVPWRDGAFNKFAAPSWSLTTKSNSTPTKVIIYGTPIPGMTAPANAQPLVPGGQYRLMVEAGSLKGQLDFKAFAAPAAEPENVPPPVPEPVPPAR